MASWAERQGEVTAHSRSYGEELQRGISVQIASAIGDLESAIGITSTKDLKTRLYGFVDFFNERMATGSAFASIGVYGY